MKQTLFAAMLALAASPALAHIDPAAHGSFAAGLTHPIFGPDHVLAMVAVGLWAAVLGGRALWALPMGFVGGMTAGFAIALFGVPMLLVEPMILASVIVLGLMVAVAVKTPLPASVALVAVLGMFHGHAHGAEMGAARVLAFVSGFVLATAALHVAGVLLAQGILLKLPPKTGRRVIAMLGGATMISGVALAFV